MDRLDMYPFKCFYDDDPDICEFVVKYLGLSVIGSGSTIGDAIKEARENLRFYLGYLAFSGKQVPNPIVCDDSFYAD